MNVLSISAVNHVTYTHIYRSYDTSANAECMMSDALETVLLLTAIRHHSAEGPLSFLAQQQHFHLSRSCHRNIKCFSSVSQLRCQKYRLETSGLCKELTVVCSDNLQGEQRQ